MKLVNFLNTSNNCYINSVLQCFIYSGGVAGDSEICKHIECIQQFIDLTNPDEYKVSTLNISNFVKYFISQNNLFNMYEQSDAHEFFMAILETLPELKKVYCGKTKGSIKCKSCGTINETIEEFNSINLNVTDNNSNVDTLIMEYLSPELHTDPNNLYYCDKCQKQVISKKILSILELPDILVVVLKKYTNSSKINNIDNFITINEVKFTLTGVINHLGDLYNGHYNCNIKINDKWIFMDDNITFLTDLNTSNAYMLFYSRLV